MNGRFALIALLFLAACSLPIPALTPVATETTPPILESISAEEYAVYDAVLAAHKGHVGSGCEYITVYDKTGSAIAFLEPGSALYAITWKNLPGATQELADNLLSANQKSASLAPGLAFEVPFVLVSSEEYGSLLRDQGERACQETVQKRYPSPKFQGWFRLSRVGFNRAMNKALVYMESFVCNGGGSLMLLEKVAGRWRIVASTAAWLT